MDNVVAADTQARDVNQYRGSRWPWTSLLTECPSQQPAGFSDNCPGLIHREQDPVTQHDETTHASSTLPASPLLMFKLQPAPRRECRIEVSARAALPAHDNVVEAHLTAQRPNEVGLTGITEPSEWPPSVVRCLRTPLVQYKAYHGERVRAGRVRNVDSARPTALTAWKLVQSTGECDLSVKGPTASSAL